MQRLRMYTAACLVGMQQLQMDAVVCEVDMQQLQMGKEGVDINDSEV